nr:S24 family peptidase [Morganella morganii]
MRAIKMSTFGERLFERRSELGMSQDELARKTGVSRVAISKIELGDSQDTRSTNLFKIAEALQCDPRWLLNGDGAPPASFDKNVENKRPEMPVRYSYPKLSWISAGQWNGCAASIEPEEWIGTDIYAGEEGYWLDVKGDSMTSHGDFSIFEGMQVLVSKVEDVRPGKYVIARINGSDESTLKQYVIDGGQIFLKPLNPRYPLTPFTSNCTIDGVVVELRMKV